jgi:membrane protein YdbS with pleckstrin-like domain
MATTEIAVTNHRLVLKTGWLGRTTNEMPLSAIENVEVHQNFMERLFGLGRLVVHGSGGGHWLTPSFAAPLAFRRAIEGATPGKRDEVVTP